MTENVRQSGYSLPLSGGRLLSTRRPALVMGILNATADSFWENSRALSLSEGIEKALALVEEGADILDIGAESTRPGAAYVEAEVELERVIPLVEGIRRYSQIPISIDTRKATVMAAAAAAGADILNDISALDDDPLMAELAARLELTVILMHKQGEPRTMQEHPVYADVVTEVRSFLLEKARAAENAGIAGNRIILDPGIGFGKKYQDNCALLSRLADITASGYPVLVGLSRKSCIGQMTGRDTADRLAGTLAANIVAVRNGARILRVHDVAAACDTLSVLSELEENANQWNS